MSWLDYLNFRDEIAGTLDQRYYTLEWLDKQILRGHAKLWCCDEAVLITEFREYPTGAKDIHVLVAAGDMGKIVGELREDAEKWAKAHGCVGSLIESRQGWAKALKPFGYEAHQLIVRKELVDGHVEE